jgi:hypothetical protein
MKYAWGINSNASVPMKEMNGNYKAPSSGGIANTQREKAALSSPCA